MNYDDDVLVDDCIIKPTKCIKLLGLYIDEDLTFSANVDNTVSKCNSRISLLRQLKFLGMNDQGLKTFFCSNI